MGAFRRKLGLRIDHIRLFDDFARDATGARIAKEVRRFERPPDHAPVIVELK
jgi:exodeoxyribonuclease-3